MNIPETVYPNPHGNRTVRELIRDMLRKIMENPIPPTEHEIRALDKLSAELIDAENAQS